MSCVSPTLPVAASKAEVSGPLLRNVTTEEGGSKHFHVIAEMVNAIYEYRQPCLYNVKKMISSGYSHKKQKDIGCTHSNDSRPYKRCTELFNIIPIS